LKRHHAGKYVEGEIRLSVALLNNLFINAQNEVDKTRLQLKGTGTQPIQLAQAEAKSMV
jgi:hypothetical protein